MSVRAVIHSRVVISFAAYKGGQLLQLGAVLADRSGQPGGQLVGLRPPFQRIVQLGGVEAEQHRTALAKFGVISVPVTEAWRRKYWFSSHDSDRGPWRSQPAQGRDNLFMRSTYTSSAPACAIVVLRGVAPELVVQVVTLSPGRGQESIGQSRCCRHRLRAGLSLI